MGRSSASGRGRRRVLGTLGLVGALAAVWLGAWGVQQWAPFAHDQPVVTWPANVRDLVAFVEHASQQPFLHTVEVEFVDGQEAMAARLGDEPTTADDVHFGETQDAVGRAFGLWNGDSSSLANTAAMESGPTRTQWLAADDVLLIDAKGPDAELSQLMRASIVLQLAVALDEQHHHLVQRRRDATSRQQAQSLAAVGLGHAVWLHDQYFDSLTIEQKSEYTADTEAVAGDYDPAVESVPPAYSALRLAAQRLGPNFVVALHDKGTDVLSGALSGTTPVAFDQISLPVAKYLTRDAPEHVSAPAVPADGTLEFTSQAGPLLLFMMVATGMVANDALTTSDAWGNDAYTVYTLGGRVCIDLHVIADSTDGADLIEQGLDAWAQVRPAEADALVGRKGTHLYVSVCDPGTDVDQTIPDVDTIDQFFGRSDMIRAQIENGAAAATAECVSITFFGRYTLSDLRQGVTDIDLQSEIESIMASCTSQF